MNTKDLVEMLIISGVMIGIFLPARLIFSFYFSDEWIGSVGVVSAFAILLFVLIKNHKLGKFGQIFERQMRKTIGGRTGKFAISFSIIFLALFATTLILIDRGYTVHQEDKELFYQEIVENENYNIENLSRDDLNGPIYVDGPVLQVFSVVEYGLSISYAIVNDITEDWLRHILIVILVEQIEVVGLLYFYRRAYRPITQIKINI